jgi:hypothetical protein
MRRVFFAALVFACATGRAAATNVDAGIMPQPNAPIRVVSCSADTFPLRNGQNFSAQASFEDVGPKTATAVRIGFAFFDAMGDRHVFSGLSAGTYTPGARIDAKSFAGQAGAETRKLVCFALEAAFTDGTKWRTNAYPSLAAAAPAVAPIPAEIVKQADAPVRFDSCTIGGPNDGTMQTALHLTNLSAKPIRRVDVDFAFFDAAGYTVRHFEWMTGNYAPGGPIRGSIKLRAGDVPFVRVACSIRRVDFVDASTWSMQAPAQP